MLPPRGGSVARNRSFSLRSVGPLRCASSGPLPEVSSLGSFRLILGIGHAQVRDAPVQGLNQHLDLLGGEIGGDMEGEHLPARRGLSIPGQDEADEGTSVPVLPSLEGDLGTASRRAFYVRPLASSSPARNRHAERTQVASP